jgi:hypothetical protein
MTGFAPVFSAIEETVGRLKRRLRWYEYPATKFVIGMFAVAVGASGGLALWVSGIVPRGLLAAVLVAPTITLFAIVAVTCWRGRSLW